MSSLTYKKLGLTVEHVWFSQRIETSNSDLILYHGMSTPPDYADLSAWRGYCKVNKQSTLISDLSLSEEELWAKIKKNTKYEIRRSKKEGIDVKFFKGKELSDVLLKQFEETYNQMYSSKHINKKMNMQLVKKYIDNNMIIFSLAYISEEPLVFHSYIVNDKHARFYFSCSPFRERSEMATLIGRMNRFLHWKDFIYLKERGIQSYDWGGINSASDPDSISKYKMAFGGDSVDQYNYIVGNTLLGKVAFRVRYNVLKKYI